MFNIKEFATHDEYVAYTADTGDFITPNVSYCRKKRECHFTSKQPQHDFTKDYLTFYAIESGTFKFSGNSIDYSLDSGQTWTTLASNTYSPTVNAGGAIMWRMSGKTPTSNKGIGRFYSSNKYKAQGNIMSIVNGDNFEGTSSISNYQFYGLFVSSVGLVSAKNLYLPPTTIPTSGYSNMFDGCTSLTEAPKLIATTLGNSCYCYMFNLCYSLTTAPELPATTLVSGCYNYMFRGCSKLNYIKALFTTTPSTSYTNTWVNGVSSTGTFVKNSAAQWDVTGINGVPTGWTIQTASN